MNNHHAALVALSPLDGRYATKTAPLAAFFSEYGLIRARIQIEIAWLKALSEHPGIPEVAPFSSTALERLDAVAQKFSVEDAALVKQIEGRTNHDVKAVEYFLQQALGDLPELKRALPFIHFACTSEDINNLAYSSLVLQARNRVLDPALERLSEALHRQARAYAHIPMLARTHGQPASPTTVGKELANFAYRIHRHWQQLRQIPIPGKLNGAVGNYNAHTAAYPDIDWIALSRQFVEAQGFAWNPLTTQIEPHDGLAEICHVLVRLNTVLLQLDRDLWGYISLGYFRQQAVAGEVGSSTMPHKVNPIDFENSEGNVGIANALLEHLAAKLPASRWQRDLTDSTAMRNLGSALGYCLLAYESTLKGLGKITPDVERLGADLDGNWDVLAEAIQTVMRRHGQESAYEQLKELTRGKGGLNATAIRSFVLALPIPEDARARLLALTPSAYTGLARTLVERYLAGSP